MIKIQALSLQRGLKPLLQDASATIAPGHKVGLVGANGCGKSSLFGLIRGQLSPDAGDCYYPSGWRMVAVEQDIPNPQRSALETVIAGHQEYAQLQQAIACAEKANQGVALAELHGRMEQIDGYRIESRAASILTGLGFSQADLGKAVTDFSGGWQMRISLARALITPADLLLLDEPTNHLDLDAVIWLEKWLQEFEGTLVLISHDKAFLDATVGEILAIEEQQLHHYKGNYSAFEIQRAEKRRLQKIAHERQMQQREKLQGFIDRFKAKASKAKQAQSRVKQLEKLEQIMPAHDKSQFSFSFAEPDKLPNPLITMDKVEAGYNQTLVLSQIKLNLVPGSRIGLLGRNGAGKSTLIKLLAGSLSPLAGDFGCSAGLHIGYFAQHQVELLQMQDSPLGHLQRLDGAAREQSLRDFLGGFGFSNDQALSQVGPMSGGEKARLVLALLVYQKPNLLLLDEPTNHLDLEMRHALTVALQSFEGAMVLVSHDRFLLEAVCDDFYLVDDGAVAPFDGTLKDYANWLLTPKEPAGAPAVAPPRLDRKAQKRRQAEFRQATRSLRQQIDKQEKAMDTHARALDELEAQLADPALYQDDNKHTLMSLLERQAGHKQALEQAEAGWMEATESLEAQQQAFEQDDPVG